jgi:predicted membrane-bound dolichyl-phosphate-mannose-protein mannosyltransferase
LRDHSYSNISKSWLDKSIFQIHQSDITNYTIKEEGSVKDINILREDNYVENIQPYDYTQDEENILEYESNKRSVNKSFVSSNLTQNNVTSRNDKYL